MKVKEQILSRLTDAKLHGNTNLAAILQHALQNVELHDYLATLKDRPLGSMRDRLNKVAEGYHNEGYHNQAEFIEYIAARVNEINFANPNYHLNYALDKLNVLTEPDCPHDVCDCCGGKEED